MTRNDIIKWILVTLSSLESRLKVRMADILSEQKNKLEEMENIIKIDPLTNGKLSQKANASFGAINDLERKTVILQNIELVRQTLDSQRLKEAANYLGSLNSGLENLQDIPTWIINSLTKGEFLLREQTFVL